MAQQRRQQATLIEETRTMLSGKVDVLAARRKDKTNLLDRQLTEAHKLNADKRASKSALDGLRKEEGRLRQALKKQEKQRQELAAAIRKSIEAEIAKEQEGRRQRA
ncbi:MAG: hypothetical protein IPH00_17625 [Flavobacteriales bacterium]|nr:hypothetical protein [Flavobacteriales bacterium]